MNKVNEYINSLRDQFLEDKAYDFCTASKIEIRGKVENPHIRFEYKDKGKPFEWIYRLDRKNFEMKPCEKINKGCYYKFGKTVIKRLYAKTFMTQGKISKNQIWKLFCIIDQEPKAFQSYMYKHFLSGYFKNKKEHSELFIESPK